VGQVTIVEPSPELRQTVLKVPVEYRDPAPHGGLPMASGSVDLVLCLSVLHHIANVSLVIGEIARVLRGGGFAIVREPTISMGDWRNPRRGLTAHERGIPLPTLREMISDAGLDVANETRCMFPLTPRVARLARIDPPYDSARAVRLDELASRLFAWNRTYHATRLDQRFRPTAVCFVLSKR
jgi:SAM-dependent methyltransferase